MGEYIKSQALKELLALKCNKLDYEEIAIEDIGKIRDIYLSAINFSGKPTEISLDVIPELCGLQELTLSDFEITQDVINKITNLECIKKVKFTRCKFDKELDFSDLAGRVSNISFSGSDISDFKYPSVEEVTIKGSIVDFDKINLEKVKKLWIVDSEISNVEDLDERENIQSVTLDGSKLFKKVQVEETKEEKQEEIQDIKVSNATRYSHEKELRIRE